MAACVISLISDADTGGSFPACMVHARDYPCPLDGEPASPVPVHAWAETRDDAIGMWAERTDRQRPLVIHSRSLRPADEHVMEDRVLPCPCNPEILAAEERHLDQS